MTSDSSQDKDCCHPSSNLRKSVLKPLPLTIIAAAILIGASYLFPAFEIFRRTFFHYLGILAGPMLLGILIGGVIDCYVPKEYISTLLARKKKRTVFFSVFLGFLMSGCSHGILALSMELHRKGASGPAVVSFLLATPWANFTITLLLLSFFGVRAFAIMIAAIAVAIVTGLIFQVLDEKKWIEENPNTVTTGEDFSIRSDLKKRFQNHVWSFANLIGDMKRIGNGCVMLTKMILWWVLFGMILASLAGAFIPQELFQKYLGASVGGLFLTLLFATVIEVCSEGSSPLAFEIYRQSGAFGNSFVFLMGGVVTDYTEIGLIWRNIGRKTALWMVAVTVPQVMLIGWLFNLVF